MRNKGTYCLLVIFIYPSIWLFSIHLLAKIKNLPDYITGFLTLFLIPIIYFTGNIIFKDYFSFDTAEIIGMGLTSPILSGMFWYFLFIIIAINKEVGCINIIVQFFEEIKDFIVSIIPETKETKQARRIEQERQIKIEQQRQAEAERQERERKIREQKNKAEQERQKRIKEQLEIINRKFNGDF